MTTHRVLRNLDEAARRQSSFRGALGYFLAGLGVDVVALRLLGLPSVGLTLAVTLALAVAVGLAPSPPLTVTVPVM